MPPRVEKLDITYPKLPKDAEGYWICRYCKKQISQGKRYRAWCSNKCSRNAEIRTYSDHARTALRKREQGVCKCCGEDTTLLDHELRLLQSAIKWDNDLLPEQRRLYKHVLETLLTAMKAVGYNCSPKCYAWSTLWQMDHILEHADGGTLDPDNLQTLCIPCHKKKTKQYMRKYND